MMTAIRFGVARGIFSNEAGLGSAGIAQAAGTSNDPVRSGLIGMMGTFIDSIIVCSMTGLAIVCSGVWSSGESGAVLSSSAFEAAMPGFGHYVISLSLMIFAFTTILGWSYYGERCWQFLLGHRAILPYRLIWIAAIRARVAARRAAKRASTSAAGISLPASADARDCSTYYASQASYCCASSCWATYLRMKSRRSWAPVRSLALAALANSAFRPSSTRKVKVASLMAPSSCVTCNVQCSTMPCRPLRD